MTRAAALAVALALVQLFPDSARTATFTVSSPLGWRADVTGHRSIVVRSPGVQNAFDSPGRVRVPRGGAYVWIFDYGRAPGREHVPSEVRLRAPAVHACGFGYGRMTLFERDGHLLQGFVKLGTPASRHTLALALRVLESVRTR